MGNVWWPADLVTLATGYGGTLVLRNEPSVWQIPAVRDEILDRTRQIVELDPKYRQLLTDGTDWGTGENVNAARQAVEEAERSYLSLLQWPRPRAG